MHRGGNMHKTVDVSVSENIFDANQKIADKNSMLFRDIMCIQSIFSVQ